MNSLFIHKPNMYIVLIKKSLFYMKNNFFFDTTHHTIFAVNM